MPPPSRTQAFSRPIRGEQFQSSPIPRARVRATRRLPSRRLASHRRTLTDMAAMRHIHRHCLGRRVRGRSSIAGSQLSPSTNGVGYRLGFTFTPLKAALRTIHYPSRITQTHPTKLIYQRFVSLKIAVLFK